MKRLNSWEQLSSLTNAPDLLSEYLRDHPNVQLPTSFTRQPTPSQPPGIRLNRIITIPKPMSNWVDAIHSTTWDSGLSPTWDAPSTPTPIGSKSPFELLTVSWDSPTSPSPQDTTHQSDSQSSPRILEWGTGNLIPLSATSWSASSPSWREFQESIERFHGPQAHLESVLRIIQASRTESTAFGMESIDSTIVSLRLQANQSLLTEYRSLEMEVVKPRFSRLEITPEERRSLPCPPGSIKGFVPLTPGLQLVSKAFYYRLMRHLLHKLHLQLDSEATDTTFCSEFCEPSYWLKHEYDFPLARQFIAKIEQQTNFFDPELICGWEIDQNYYWYQY